MYQSHWGLQASPFRDCLDPQFFYQSPTHDEALARLHFLVEQRRRLGLLMGRAGSGKSLVLEVLAAQLRRSGRTVAHFGMVGLDPVEMLDAIVAALGVNLDRAAGAPVVWRALTDRLAEYRYQCIDTAVLLDDADMADHAVLPHLLRLAKFDPSPQSRLTLVLAGQRERFGWLGDSMLGLSELRVDLEPWQAGDVAEFLKTSLKQAGRPTTVFAETAIERLHELSRGIPRNVRQLADLALVVGAGRHLDQIDADVVESVFQELGTVEV